jgi:hypothetical protein
MSGLLVAFVLFTITGAAVALIAGARGVGTTIERMAEMYLLGLGSVGTALFIAGLVHLPIGRGTVAALFALGAAVLVWRRTEAAQLFRESDSRERLLLPAIVLTIPLISILLSTQYVPLHDYDGRVFWVLKAKAIATEHSIDGGFFRGKGAYDPRNEYPLLMPLNDAAIFSLAGTLDDRLVQGLYALCAAALLLVLRNRLSLFYGAVTGSWLAALAAWLPQLSFNGEGGAIGAYSDLPLAAFAACAFFAVMDAEHGSASLFPLWLVFLVLTKNEGMIIALVLVVIALLKKYRAANARGAAIAFGSSVMALSIWRYRILPGDEENLPRLLLHFPSHLNRFFPATAAFGMTALEPRTWGFFWIAVGICAVTALLKRRDAWAPALLLVAMLSIYDCVYMETTWRMEDLVATSANRLLIQLIGPALFLLAAGSEAIFGVVEVSKGAE